MEEVIDPVSGEIVSAKALPLIQIKDVALSRFGDWRSGAVALVEKYRGVVFDVATTKGMKEAVAARMEVREPRYAAQNVAKASKSELAAVSKAVGEEEAAIIKFLAETEEHIDQQIRAEEERKARVKAEAERLAAEAAAAEAERVKRHRDAIGVLEQYPIHAVGLPAERIEKGVKALQEMVFGEAQEECIADYQAARDAALAKMLAMLDEAWKREAEEIRVRALQAELARREKALAEREAAMEALMAKAEAERLAAEAKIVEAARQAEERLREMTSPPKPVWVGVDLGTNAPGAPPAADQPAGDTQASTEPAEPPAAAISDLPGIPPQPTDEEAAATAPNLITLGEVCRRTGASKENLAMLGFVPDAVRGRGKNITLYFKERSLIHICHAFAVHFTKLANKFEEELADVGDESGHSVLHGGDV